MSTQGTGRKPDWELRYLNKDTDEKSQAGVGWNNDDGSIRIKLNARIMLIGEKSCILTLFKEDRQRKVAQHRGEHYDRNGKLVTGGSDDAGF
jgi:hypothetical protein